VCPGTEEEERRVAWSWADGGRAGLGGACGDGPKDVSRHGGQGEAWSGEERNVGEEHGEQRRMRQTASGWRGGRLRRCVVRVGRGDDAGAGRGEKVSMLSKRSW